MMKYFHCRLEDTELRLWSPGKNGRCGAHLYQCRGGRQTIPGVPWPARLASLLSSRPMGDSLSKDTDDILEDVIWGFPGSSTYMHTHVCAHMCTCTYTGTQNNWLFS